MAERPPSLQDLLVRNFDKSMITDVAQQVLGLNMDDISDTSAPKTDMARKLIQYAEVRGLLDELINGLASYASHLTEDLYDFLYLIMMREFDAADLGRLCQELQLDCQALKLDKKGLRGVDRNDFIKRERVYGLQVYMKEQQRRGELVQAIQRRADENLYLGIFEDLIEEESGGAVIAGPSPIEGNVISDSPPPVRVYENFDIYVDKGGDGRYSVEVRQNPLRREMRRVWRDFPLDDYDFTDLVGYLSDLVAQAQDAKALGQQMFDLLFPPEVRRIYESNLSHVKEQGKGLRIRLRLDPPELSSLPWEYCFQGSFLALDRETPIIRYIYQDYRTGDLKLPRPVKVIVATSEPSDQAQLDVTKELNYIRKLLGLMGNVIDLQVLEHATPNRLQQAFQRRPHIFHFIGHGDFKDGQGMLILEDDSGKSSPLTAEQLMILMGNIGLKLVILNACKTAAQGTREAMLGLAPALVKAEIPAVIAMQFNVPDKTALSFTENLYRSLVAGFPLDEAITEMRIGAFITGNDGYFWGIPTLFMRSPDGILWERSPEMLALFEKALREAGEMGDEDLPTQVEKLAKAIAAIRNSLDSRDADYINRDLEDIQGTLSETKPDIHYVRRGLEGIIRTLERVEMDAAQKIVTQAKALIQLAEETLS